MKLPIKKVWFDQIKDLKKPIEFRDAHVTLVCEETGEMLRADVTGVHLQSKAGTRDYFNNLSDKKFDAMFSDDRQIAFVLSNIRPFGLMDKLKYKFGFMIQGKKLVCPNCGESDDIVESQYTIECLACGKVVNK